MVPMLLGIDDGGQATTSASVEPEAVDETQDVIDEIPAERLGGSDRFATAATIATDHGGNPERVYLATGQDYPDALAAGAVAGASDAPVLLTGSGVLPGSTHSALATLAPDEVVVVGGTAAIGGKVAAAAGEAAGADVRRIAGAHRLDTAAQLVDELDGGVDAVYVATGEGFADALAGGAVAGLEGAPLLLTGGERLPLETGEVIEGLDPERIEVLGGTAAITDGVVAELEQLSTATITRHAGADRFATAAEVVDARVEEADHVFIATGENYPDALSGGAAAARQNAPLLLTGRDELPAEAGAVLSRLAPASLTVLGGEAAVSEGVLSQARQQVSAAHHQPDHCGGPPGQRPDHCDDGEIAGTVTDSDSGDPIDGATVSTDTGESATTNSDGDYTLAALDPGDYDVTADADGFQSATETGVTVEENTTTTVDFSLTTDDNSTDDTSVDRLLSGDVSLDGFTVPAGEVWAFDPDVDTTVESTENVVVKGTLQLRPTDGDVEHTLRFVDVDESAFQGGGMEVLETDVGLWVTDDGILDAKGTAKTTWTRDGWDTSWNDTDDVYQLPISKGEYNAKPFDATDEVDSVTNDGRTYNAEVVNLTRNVTIEGTPDGNAHVLFMTNGPQTVRNVELAHVGVEVERDNFPAHQSGRYGLHFHHMDDASRDSLIENVVVRQAGNHAFVPHASHGVTFRSTVAFDTRNSAYWWDPEKDDDESTSPNATDDLTLERAVSHDARASDQTAGSQAAFYMADGTGNQCVDCVATGLKGTRGSSAFYRPNSEGPPWELYGPVAHNNKNNGFYLWENKTFTADRNLGKNAVVYRNGDWGVELGAYRNRHDLVGAHLFDNGKANEVLFRVAPSCHDDADGCDPYSYIHGGTFDAAGKDYSVSIQAVALDYAPDGRAQWSDLTFQGWQIAAFEVDTEQFVQHDFIRVNADGSGRDLKPEDFDIVQWADGSNIRVQRFDCTAYRINDDESVDEIDPFAEC